MNSFWLGLRDNLRKSFTEIRLTDMSYSWWVNPISIYHEGFNYFSCIDINGDRQIFKFNLEGGSLNSQAFSDTVDEHSTSAILPLDDNTLLCVFTGHNTTPLSYFKLSLDDLTFTQAKSDISLSTDFSYVQLIKASGKIFCFSRDDRYVWSLFISDDNGTTFGNKIVFLNKDNSITDKLYIATQLTGTNVIKFGAYNHPFSGNNNVLNYFEMNTDSGDITSLGVLIGNLYTNFVPIEMSALTPIYTLADANGNMDRFRFLGSVTTKGVYSYFPIAEFLISEIADFRAGDYRMVRVNNNDFTVSIFDIIPHGKDSNWSYFGGVYFVQSENGEWNNEIYLSREENEIWYCERYEFTGADWVLKELIDTQASGSNNNAGPSIHRPQPPYNSDKFGAKLSYQKGDYFEGYVNWDNEIIIK